MEAEEAGAPGAEELAQSDKEHAAAQAEIDRLRAEASDERNRAEIAIAEAARLGAELAAASDAAAAFEADITSMRSMLDEADKRAVAGAARYRDLAVRSEPALPPDMITGDTIEAVDASLAAARDAGRTRPVAHRGADADGTRPRGRAEPQGARRQRDDAGAEDPVRARAADVTSPQSLVTSH